MKTVFNNECLMQGASATETWTATERESATLLMRVDHFVMWTGNHAMTMTMNNSSNEGRPFCYVDR